MSQTWLSKNRDGEAQGKQGGHEGTMHWLRMEERRYLHLELRKDSSGQRGS